MLSPVLKITFRAERRFEMAYVTVPKDLTKIKSKVMFNLTKRQLICFSAAVAIGLPLFFLVKGSVGTSAAAVSYTHLLIEEGVLRIIFCNAPFLVCFSKIKLSLLLWPKE